MTAGRNLSGSEINKSRSSAYKVNLCSTPPLMMPCTWLDLRAAANGSIAMANNRGESNRVDCHSVFRIDLIDVGY